MKPIQFTKDGFQSLKQEYADLIGSKRADAIARLAKARAMGDLSENSEYVAAKEDLSFIEGRIQEIEMLMQNAVVMDNNMTGNIDIGTEVIVEKDSKNETYYIVGEFEADPMSKKLSATSPIGKALLGKKKGDTVTVEVPAGKLNFRIIEVKQAA
ncbi:MAG: transcription elongation factor GreA [Weeksellaceae bacterium]